MSAERTTCSWCRGPHTTAECDLLQRINDAVDLMPTLCERCGYPRTDTAICRECGEGRAA